MIDNNIKESVYTEYEYKVFNKCPVCLNKNIQRKGRRGTGDTQTHPQVFKCTKCRVFFVNPIIDIKSLYNLYENFNITYGTHSDEAKNKIKQDANHWNKLFSEKNNRKEKFRFLDIGSASGELMKAFSDCGWDPYGIEPCKTFVDYSIKKMGLSNVQHSTVEEAKYPDDYFEFIHFWHVIEHLIDPKKALENIYSWLKPGGILNLGTPSPDSLITKIYPQITGYFDLGSFHTFFFPKQSLNLLLKSIGFEVTSHLVYSTPKSGTNIKIKTHNLLHYIFPKAVANFQKVVARKPESN